MIGNEMTEIEKKLWKKVFRFNNSAKEYIKRLQYLNEKCESEFNIMNAPSKENVDKLVSTKESLRMLMMASFQCEAILVRLNPNFHLN
ncbi:MAG TPA: hypothetical protein PJ987_09525 [Bacteroidia bacterium]|nr:hypothetical protein [Bacteroidia bacterium]HMY42182.1 hypothetical protein [Chitinophagales bacterium]